MSNMLRCSILLLPVMIWAQTPAALAPPKDQALLFKLAGKGSQIYFCQNAAWVLKAPKADLFDDKGELAGKHFQGPTWQAKDGSQVKGKMAATVPSPESASVPWLLLNVVSHEGQGIMSTVQSIQRLETKGGKAPVAACAGNQETSVPYEANYYFYGAR